MECYRSIPVVHYLNSWSPWCKNTFTFHNVRVSDRIQRPLAPMQYSVPAVLQCGRDVCSKRHICVERHFLVVFNWLNNTEHTRNQDFIDDTEVFWRLQVANSETQREPRATDNRTRERGFDVWRGGGALARFYMTRSYDARKGTSNYQYNVKC